MNFTEQGQEYKSKKKFVGTATLFTEDGQPVPVAVAEQEFEGDFNFNKFWLKDYIYSMQLLANEKMRVAFWIIDHLNSKNEIVFSQRDVSVGAEVSLKTVNRTIKDLLSNTDKKGNPIKQFLVKVRYCLYQVNPEIIYKGSHDMRMGVITIFKQRVAESQKPKLPEKTLFDDISDEPKVAVN